MTSGKGLDGLRSEILKSKDIQLIVDIEDTVKIFPTVKLNCGLTIVSNDKTIDNKNLMNIQLLLN
jgi:hypothetical protein